MTNGRRLPRTWLWLSVAVVGALVGVTLQLAAVGSSPASPVTLVAVERPSVGADGRVAQSGQPDAAPIAAPAVSAAGSNTEPNHPAEDRASANGGTVTAPAVAGAVATPNPGTRLALRIPALGIDARVVSLGFTEAGQLDVPDDGASIGWYDISPRPGEPGNALLGAHFDWDGALAVFGGLSRLAPGDLVFVDDGVSGSLAYEVTLATSVGWDHPVADILASNGSESSLTLFTCGGAFDATRSEYDERVIVRAVLAEPSPSLAASR